MRVIREYKRAESLEEAWQLNQKKSNRVLGGMVWLKMGKMQVNLRKSVSLHYQHEIRVVSLKLLNYPLETYLKSTI